MLVGCFRYGVFFAFVRSRVFDFVKVFWYECFEFVYGGDDVIGMIVCDEFFFILSVCID